MEYDFDRFGDRYYHGGDKECDKVLAEPYIRKREYFAQEGDKDDCGGEYQRARHCYPQQAVLSFEPEYAPCAGAY